jgi:glutaminyl-tRNA synthetase
MKHKHAHAFVQVLEDTSPRAFAVLNPIKLTITNWPEGKVEMFEADCHPQRCEALLKPLNTSVCFKPES